MDEFLLELIKDTLKQKYKVLAWICILIVTALSVWNFYDPQNKKLSGAVCFLLILCFTVLGAIFNVIQSVKDRKRQKTLEGVSVELEKSKAELDAIKKAFPKILEGCLISISETLSLGNTERVTLYLARKDNSDMWFYPCSRYSKSPIFCGINRVRYPNKGVIAKIWTDEWHFNNSFPDPKKTRRLTRLIVANTIVSPRGSVSRYP